MVPYIAVHGNAAYGSAVNGVPQTGIFKHPTFLANQWFEQGFNVVDKKIVEILSP